MLELSSRIGSALSSHYFVFSCDGCNEWAFLSLLVQYKLFRFKSYMVAVIFSWLKILVGGVTACVLSMPYLIKMAWK